MKSYFSLSLLFKPYNYDLSFFFLVKVSNAPGSTSTTDVFYRFKLSKAIVFRIILLDSACVILISEQMCFKTRSRFSVSRRKKTNMIGFRS